jgi:hypothetical protein
MYETAFKSLLFILILTAPLLYLQRFLQREIQSIFLLITHQQEVSMALFSLLFLPGVFLHEISHFLMAHLLGVKTGRFSLVPKKMGSGSLQLGYVETAATDFFRDALIGAAPLIVGVVFIAIIGVSRLNLNAFQDGITGGQASSMRAAVDSIVHQPDFWLWFYLTFTISSTMMPSSSDRRAWLPLLLVTGILALIVFLSGIGPWLYAHLGSLIEAALNAIMIVFGTTILIHIFLLIPAWGIRKIISRISGYQVV